MPIDYCKKDSHHHFRYAMLDDLAFGNQNRGIR